MSSWEKYRAKHARGRSSNRKLMFTTELLNETAEKILNGQSLRATAKEYDIPEATLRKRLKSVATLILRISNSYLLAGITG